MTYLDKQEVDPILSLLLALREGQAWKNSTKLMSCLCCVALLSAGYETK